MLINLIRLENDYLWEHRVSKSLSNLDSLPMIGITTFYMTNKTHYIAFSTSGNGKAESFYKNNKRHGLSRVWRNGILYINTPYKNGKIHGKAYCRTVYYTETITFKRDVKHGIRKQYYLTGILKSVTWYKNDQINRTCKYYYESGKIQMVVPMRNGKEHGKCEIYDENGQLQTVEIYENGQWLSRIIKN